MALLNIRLEISESQEPSKVTEKFTEGSKIIIRWSVHHAPNADLLLVMAFPPDFLLLHPSGLPCSCPDTFVPVCATNGRTYPSACVARCLGFRDHQFVFGLCRSSNPCANKPCQRSQRYEQVEPYREDKPCGPTPLPSSFCIPRSDWQPGCCYRWRWLWSPRGPYQWGMVVILYFQIISNLDPAISPSFTV